MEQINYYGALDNQTIAEKIEKLSLSDLHAFSKTCEQLQRLAGTSFHQKYPELVSKTVSILCADEKVEFYSEDERYKKNFGNYIENVKIFGKSEKLAPFLLSKCSKNVREIDFSEHTLNPMMLQQIEPILMNLKAVGVLYHDAIIILQYCQQLKYLQLSSFIFSKLRQHTDLLRRINVQSLEVFDYTFTFYETLKNAADELNDLRIFFRRNINVRRFICRVIMDKLDLVKKLLAIVAEMENIDEFFLVIYSDKEDRDLDFALIADDLKMINDREQFKRFELKVDLNKKMKNLGKLSCLNKLKGLLLPMIENGNFDEVDISSICSFTNLKLLQIDPMYYNGDYVYVHDTFSTIRRIFCSLDSRAETLVHTYTLLAKRLTKLEELHCAEVRTISEDDHISMNEFIRPFVRHSANLRKIVLPFIKIDTNVLEYVEQLNDDRTLLANAKKLTIFVDETQNDLQESMDNDLVDIKRTKFERKTGLRLDHPNPNLNLTYKDV